MDLYFPSHLYKKFTINHTELPKRKQCFLTGKFSSGMVTGLSQCSIYGNAYAGGLNMCRSQVFCLDNLAAVKQGVVHTGQTCCSPLGVVLQCRYVDNFLSQVTTTSPHFKLKLILLSYDPVMQ